MPKHAPASREQWKDWNQVWPTSWRKPELTAVTAATAAAQAVTAAEEHQMHIWMDRAYALAEANADSGNVCNAAVIVDPVSGEVCHYITSRCPILCYVTFQGCTLIVNLLCYIVANLGRSTWGDTLQFHCWTSEPLFARPRFTGTCASTCFPALVGEWDGGWSLLLIVLLLLESLRGWEGAPLPVGRRVGGSNVLGIGSGSGHACGCNVVVPS